MAIAITIPRLGWSMDEGVFGEWLKRAGEFVRAGDPLFTLESEKALQEVESVDEGILHIVPAGPREGDTIPVGAVVAYLLAEGEPPPAGPTDSRAEPSEPAVADAVPARNAGEPAGNDPRPAQTVPAPGGAAASLPTISPRAARAARELSIDWTRLNGTGRSGRIRERDVRAAAAAKPARTSSGLRRTIAERMLASVRTTAPVTLTTKADATNLVSLREQFKAAAEPAPAYHDIVAKLVAAALRRHPVMNGRWTKEGVVESEGLHIGIAVDTDAGLLVPVVRDADRLSLRELAARSRDLVERARARACTADELSGGTFTITNLGAYGIDAFTPIINTPEAAVLGLGTIRREPVVLSDDRIVPRDRITLSMTFDHRITDGAPAARFLQTLAAFLENPAPSLID